MLWFEELVDCKVILCFDGAMQWCIFLQFSPLHSLLSSPLLSSPPLLYSSPLLLLWIEKGLLTRLGWEMGWHEMKLDGMGLGMVSEIGWNVSEIDWKGLHLSSPSPSVSCLHITAGCEQLVERLAQRLLAQEVIQPSELHEDAPFHQRLAKVCQHCTVLPHLNLPCLPPASPPHPPLSLSPPIEAMWAAIVLILCLCVCVCVYVSVCVPANMYVCVMSHPAVLCNGPKTDCSIVVL